MSDMPESEVVQPDCVEALFKREFAEKVQRVVLERECGQEEGEPLRQMLAGLLGDEAPGGAAALWARQLKIAVCTQHLAARAIYAQELASVGSQQDEEEEQGLPYAAALEEEFFEASSTSEGQEEAIEEAVMEEKVGPAKESPAAVHAPVHAAAAAEVVPQLSLESKASHFAESEALLYDEEMTATESDEASESAIAAETEEAEATEAATDPEEKAAEGAREFSPEELKRVRADFLQRYASGNLTKEEQTFLKELEKNMPQGDYSQQAKNPNILATKTFSQVAIDGNREPKK